jgi:hypothetical protein
MQLYIYGAALASALYLEVIIYQNIHSLYDYLFYRETWNFFITLIWYKRFVKTFLCLKTCDNGTKVASCDYYN